MSRTCPPLLGLILAGWCLVYRADCLVESASLSCAVRREISPCTCQNKAPIRSEDSTVRLVVVACERMTSFEQVLTAVKNKFEPDVHINLRISYSALDDLPQRSFSQMGLKITYLDLSNDNISSLPESVFLGAGQWAEHLGLSNNPLGSVPRSVIALMPRLRVLDLNMANITNITSMDFQGLRILKNLLLTENKIDLLEEDSLPTSLLRLQLGNNRIKCLNGTVRKMYDLQWLIINNNQIESLDDELPSNVGGDVLPNSTLELLMADHNRLRSLPNSLHYFRRLNYANFKHNNIANLNRALAKNKRLHYLNLEANNISTLAENEFSDLEELKELFLGWNRIERLNRSLTPLKSLQALNLTHNSIGHFSFQELAGLTRLLMVDLSYNAMHTLSSRTQNQIESVVRVVDLRLQFNRLSQLGGALSDVSELKLLNLSHNHIQVIQPNDLVGLNDLEILDVSYNRILTFEETSKTVLIGLEELRASHNAIRVLERDFRGFPRLCRADLSYNDILSMDPTLTDSTQCQLHGVNSTLRIYLSGNPVLCDPLMEPVVTMIEMKNVKIRGTTECEKFAALLMTTAIPTSTTTQPSTTTIPKLSGTTESPTSTVTPIHNASVTIPAVPTSTNSEPPTIVGSKPIELIARDDTMVEVSEVPSMNAEASNENIENTVI